MYLIVITPFESYVRGDVITDAEVMDQILASDQFNKVVQVTLPAPPQE